MNKLNCAGIWFYGLAGSGKTYASEIISQILDTSFIIDGDDVRKYVSMDLDYSINDRNIQVSRLLGIARIAIKNGYKPIISSVNMNEKTQKLCSNLSINLIEITRDFDSLKLHREIYTDGKDVIGVDIDRPNLKTKTLYNDGTKKFNTDLLQHVKQIQLF